ncbi:hypothetical protein T11_14901 [Trichinella zimbabwensis]|uniref:Uncharacterized protein n=1 Tax=Trichinella zimbabwensis TaxID=268475 RepID=A0A0V1H2B7_9BILA|nr:hypothetical protein T11_14901 [Trichinella zimbabwensis]
MEQSVEPGKLVKRRPSKAMHFPIDKSHASFRSVERRFSNLATVMDCFEAMQMYALKENLTIEAMVVLVLWDFAELPAILLTFTTNNDG